MLFIVLVAVGKHSVISTIACSNCEKTGNSGRSAHTPKKSNMCRDYTFTRLFLCYNLFLAMASTLTRDFSDDSY